MTHNLEQQLGELSGQLKALVPALERLEGRVREVESQVSAATIRLEGLRTDLTEYKDKTDLSIKKLTDKAGGLRDSLRTLADQVARISKKDEGMSQKVWEIAKLILAAAIGAAASFVGRKP
jgi:chromosome segregation ATPase